MMQHRLGFRASPFLKTAHSSGFHGKWFYVKATTREDTAGPVPIFIGKMG